MLRFLCASALRRLGIWSAVGTLVVMAAASLAAREHGGGYPEGGSRRYGVTGGLLPLGWFTYSRRAYQSLMRMLAERSASLQGAGEARDAAREAPAPYEPDEDARQRPRPGWEEHVPEPEDRRGRPSRQGGEAKAGRNRTTLVREDAWRPPRPARCRSAGVEVEGGGWYVVQPGDTLSSIAQAHYGTSRAYWRIVSANWRTISDPSLIYACQRIYIPR